MKYNQHTYKICVEPVSPVYVGGASEKNLVKDLDVINKNSKVYLIDHDKLSDILKNDKKLLQEYTLAASENKLKEFIEKINFNLEDISLRIFHYKFNLENDIKAFIRNGFGQPYLPGSSIKGALRSVLYYHFVKTLYALRKEIRNYENEVFGSIDNNLMKFIHISDIPFHHTQLINTKIFSIKGNFPDNFKGGWKKSFSRGDVNQSFYSSGFTTPYEILLTNNKGSGSITFNQIFVDFIKKQNKNLPPNIDKFSNTPVQILFNLVNQYTQTHLEREIAFFKKYQNDKTGEILNELKKLKDSIPEENTACLLRLGGGSGFHSVTGDWQFETHEITGLSPKNRGQYRGKDSAKTRKIAFIQNEENSYKFFSFGFVKISLISEEEYESIRNKVALQESERTKTISEEVAEKPQIKPPDKITTKPPEPVTPKAPEPFKGPIKQGTGKIPAQVVKSGKPNNVKLLIENNEMEIPLMGYSSPLETGKYVFVRVTQYSKGKIIQVNFEDFIRF